jgi:hypothetical protein
MTLDHFTDPEAEEAVLFHMVFHNRQSKLLTAAHFTSDDRRVIFTAIQEGAPYETIERIPLDVPGYVTDLFFAPATAPTYLKEAVQNLRRLKELRDLRDRVKRWEHRAPGLTLQKARSELAQVLR